MRNQHYILKGRIIDDDNFKDEIGLGGYVGNSWRRKIGTDDNADSSENKFEGKCHHCGKKGHKKNECFHLEKNKDNRPKGFKVKEFGAKSADTDDDLDI